MVVKGSIDCCSSITDSHDCQLSNSQIHKIMGCPVFGRELMEMDMGSGLKNVIFIGTSLMDAPKRCCERIIPMRGRLLGLGEEMALHLQTSYEI